MSIEQDSPDIITFLGTAGARFMVSRQLAASGGIWLNLSGTQILLDPGPGSIVQSTKRKLNAEKLSAIILSHRHLDHAADANVMVEAMTNGGFHRHGMLFAPADALASEPVVFSYLRNYIEGVTLLEEGKSYRVGSVTFETPLRHIHPVETYGIIFRTPRHNFAYIADTRYFESLEKKYVSDMLIINMVLTEPRPPIDHLSIPDVERIISGIRPKLAVLSHFGMHVWQARPWEIAARLSEQTGVKVIAARDGMKLDLAKLDDVQATNGQH
jgi:ribonuclease BN (tRNA processing enzyme)